MRLFGRKKPAVKVDWENSTELHTHGQEPVVISYTEDAADANADTEAAWAGDDEAMAQAQEEARRRQACLEAYKRELSEAEGCQGCFAGEVMDTMNCGDDGEDPDGMPQVLQDTSGETRSRSNSMDSAPSIEDARGMSSIRDGELDSYEEPGQEWSDDREKKGGRSRLKWALIACACVLLICLIAMGVVISQNKKKEQDELALGNTTGVVEGDNPDAAPGEEEENIFEEGIKECDGKADYLIYTSCEAFNEPGSPQWKAWNWLMNADEAVVTVEAGASEFEIQQRFAAATLYYATRGENWESDLGFLSPQSICNWNDGDVQGIFCEEGAVTEINIAANNLVGFIPNEMDYFSQLKIMNLYYGKLTGRIPDFAPLKELEQIDFDGNNLTGKVPESIFNLPKMRNLLLLNNEGLKGRMPEIQEGSKLERLSLYECSFNGPLPSSLGSASSLELLQLRGNAFTGTIPPSLFALSSLETLGLRGNRLEGVIPNFSVPDGSVMESLSLGGNQFQGTIPSAIGGLTALKHLYLQENQFTGTIAPEIMSLPALEHIWAYSNGLSGDLPDVSLLSNTMKVLFLDKNDFAGSMDNILANAPSTLERIDLSSNNRIQGLVTNDIGRFTSMLSFNASYCGLSGGLRGDGLSALTQLEAFAVAGNSLTDPIPSRIASMTNLATLDLSKNDFTGTLPVEMANMENLSYLDISQNPNLSGDLDSIVCDSLPMTAIADCAGNDPIQCSCCSSCL